MAPVTRTHLFGVILQPHLGQAVDVVGVAGLNLL
jgi:hypothetical protein